MLFSGYFDQDQQFLLFVQVRVRPKCGRLVGFSAGKENMHGVMGVTKGRRCAVALWFTSDVDHKEAAFDAAAETMAGQ